MKFNSLNTKNLGIVRKAIDGALVAVGEELNMSIKTGHCSYSEKNCDFKLKVALIGEDGQVHSQVAEDFLEHANMYGLKPEDLNRVFKCNGMSYTIIGLKSRNTKYPILVQVLDTNKTLKMTARGVRMALNRKEDSLSL